MSDNVSKLPDLSVPEQRVLTNAWFFMDETPEFDRAKLARYLNYTNQRSLDNVFNAVKKKIAQTAADIAAEAGGVQDEGSDDGSAATTATTTKDAKGKGLAKAKPATVPRKRKAAGSSSAATTSTAADDNSDYVVEVAAPAAAPEKDAVETPRLPKRTPLPDRPRRGRGRPMVSLLSSETVSREDLDDDVKGEA